MSYRIKITECREVRKVIAKEWRKVGQENKGGGALADVYDYTPETETLVLEEVLRLDQTVETLDLPEVIKAINGL